jgi:hypothetical protein
MLTCFKCTFVGETDLFFLDSTSKILGEGLWLGQMPISFDQEVESFFYYRVDGGECISLKSRNYWQNFSDSCCMLLTTKYCC